MTLLSSIYLSTYKNKNKYVVIWIISFKEKFGNYNFGRFPVARWMEMTVNKKV